MHVWEYDAVTVGNEDLAQIQMWDAAGNEMLAKTQVQEVSGKGYTWNTTLQAGTYVFYDNQTDLLTFDTEATQFNSSSSLPVAWCDTGNWATVNVDEKERQMDCYFWCPWTLPNGGGYYPSETTLKGP